MFSILNEVLQKLEDGSPKAKLLFDFIIRLFQKKNDKSIVMRCFLRDFVGANDSGRFNFISSRLYQESLRRRHFSRDRHSQTNSLK